MTATLWLDSAAGRSLELGPTLPLYAALADMRRAAGPGFFAEWPDLGGLVSQVESQADADPGWLADARAQAAAFLRRHRGALAARTVRVLEALAGAPAANAFCATGEGGGVDPTCSPGGPSGGEGKPSGVLARLKAAGAKAAHLEHAAAQWAKDRLADAAARLPGRLGDLAEAAFHAARAGTAAAFSNFTAAQALAERVARERGATPGQARALRGVLTSIDMRTFEVLKVAAVAGVHAAHLPAAAAAAVPVASASYLAYSTAASPAATLRAARGLVRDTLRERHGAKVGAAPKLARPGLEGLGTRNREGGEHAGGDDA